VNTESQKSQDPAQYPPDPPTEISHRSNAASLTFLGLSGQMGGKHVNEVLEIASMDYYPEHPLESSVSLESLKWLNYGNNML